MWYLGGKHRQAKAIAAAVREYHPSFEVYVEPFCGALSSACAIIRAFPVGRTYILNDANTHLITFWQAALDGWDPPATIDEVTYRWYRDNRPADDPMTAYVGFAWSFGGKLFGGLARSATRQDKRGANGQNFGSYAGTMRKIVTLRLVKDSVIFTCGDYASVPVPDGAMVYLDPPYEGRTKQASHMEAIDVAAYVGYASSLSSRCVVMASQFGERPEWVTVHNWGDTVVRHRGSKGRDGTYETLQLVT